MGLSQQRQGYPRQPGRLTGLYALLLVLVFIAGLLSSIMFFSDHNGRSEPGQLSAAESTTTEPTLPSFTTRELGGNRQLSDLDLQLPAVINLWASWCTACRYEHPLLVDLQQQGVRLYGINHLDQQAAALAWLANYSDPFRYNLVDEAGRIGAALGVYGLPETLLVTADRRILVHHRGTLTPEVWQQKFAPQWQRLNAL